MGLARPDSGLSRTPDGVGRASLRLGFFARLFAADGRPTTFAMGVLRPMASPGGRALGRPCVADVRARRRHSLTPSQAARPAGVGGPSLTAFGRPRKSAIWPARCPTKSIDRQGHELRRNANPLARSKPRPLGFRVLGAPQRIRT